MPTITTSTTFDRLEPAGPPRTTGAGRFALPVAMKDGKYTVGTVDLVFDERAALELMAALERHLAGKGTPAPGPRRSRADLLQ